MRSVRTSVSISSLLLPLLLPCTLACALVAGCSALVSPDPGRLGGSDGSVGLDAGGGDAGGTDAGMRDGGILPDGGRDAGPICPTDCNDSVACTVDRCVDGSCVNTPNNGLCGDGQRCNPVMGCVPIVCTNDDECDNGIFCDGEESCDPGGGTPTGCVPGTAPDCADMYACTIDRCDEDAGACAHDPDDAMCADTIDCTVDACAPGPGSGNDGCTHRADDSLCDTQYCRTGSMCTRAGCSAGMARNCTDNNVCTTDACDEGARMCISVLRDDDMDGVGPISVSSAGGADVLCGGTDCNDMNAAVRPGATELCNAIDDNCDGRIDEGCPAPRLPDDCGSATVIRADGAGSFTLPAPLPTLGALRDDYQASPLCNPQAGGRDAVYALDIVGRRDVVIDTIGSGADTILAVSATCSADGFRAQSVCNDDYGGSAVGTASRIWLHRIGAPTATTRVYILVDGYNASATGSYQLNVRWGDPASDGCATSIPLDITGGGTVLGTITNFTSFQAGSCGTALAPEAVMRFTGPTSGNVRLTTYSTDFTPDTYLRTACGSGELACVTATDIGGGVNRAEIRRSVTSGAMHYFFVDDGRTAGTYAVYYQPF